MIEDPTFFGIASVGDHVCDDHGLKPRKCVAFQGVDTGRRFYMCLIENVSRNASPCFRLYFSDKFSV
jgi:hypothetical protein